MEVCLKIESKLTEILKETTSRKSKNFLLQALARIVNVAACVIHEQITTKTLATCVIGLTLQEVYYNVSLKLEYLTITNTMFYFGALFQIIC